MEFLFVIDAPESLKAYKDSSVAMMRAAQKRGHAVWACEVQELHWLRNRVAARQNDREGNKLALANIRERLSLMYGERALVKAGQFDEEYIVTLRFPHVEDRAKLPA